MAETKTQAAEPTRQAENSYAVFCLKKQKGVRLLLREKKKSEANIVRMEIGHSITDGIKKQKTWD